MEQKLLETQSSYLTSSYLFDLFSELKKPRNKVLNLVNKGELIHIKKGLYLHGDIYKKNYSKAVLSGLIYGPSAISFEYALSLHGLIPERVELITCLTFKRNKSFSTPIGNFHYKHISKKLFPIELDYVQTQFGNYYLASAEKALCDMVYFQKFESIEKLKPYLLESLRIDFEDLKKLDMGRLLLLEKYYKRESVQMLVETIRSLR